MRDLVHVGSKPVSSPPQLPGSIPTLWPQTSVPTSTSQAPLLFLRHSCHACTQTARKPKKVSFLASTLGRHGLLSLVLSTQFYSETQKGGLEEQIEGICFSPHLGEKLNPCYSSIPPVYVSSSLYHMSLLTYLFPYFLIYSPNTDIVHMMKGGSLS